MKYLLASAVPYLPQLTGGIEVNTHLLALELNRRACETAVLCKLSLRDSFGARRFLAIGAHFTDVAMDRFLGYRVYRSMKPWRDLSGVIMPKIAIIQNGHMVQMGHAFRNKSIPSIAYLHGTGFDTEGEAWKGTGKELPFSGYIANSTYTARRFEARFGIRPEVIPPIFYPEEYRTAGKGRHVTFINPVAEKGVDLALAIAALCPEIPFLFVRGWPLSPIAEMRLSRRLARLDNVRLCPRSRNMAKIYAETRILLVPSQWDETWGRVVSEAQFSGIPVLASDCGGLPESVGPGGILVGRKDPPEVWAEQLRSLWNEPAKYQFMRESAFAHAARPALDIGYQLDRFMSIAEGIAG